MNKPEAAKDPVAAALEAKVMDTARQMGKADFTPQMAELSAELIMKSQEDAGQPLTLDMVQGSNDMLSGAIHQAVDLRLQAAAAERSVKDLDVNPDLTVERRA